MHITHIVAHPPFREGTGTACYYSARALEDLGCRISIYSTRQRDLNTGNMSMKNYHLLPSWLSIGNAYLTPGLLGMNKTDIFHLHFPYIFGSELTTIRSRIIDVPMVLTYHSDLVGNGVRRILFWLYNKINTPLIFRQARKIIVLSFDFAKSSIFANIFFGRREADLVEVSNGVDTDSFRPDIDSAFVRSQNGITASDFVLLFVSSLDRSHACKGLDLLLESLSRISIPEIKLLIVGGGDMQSEYEKQAQSLGLMPRVRFLGRNARSSSVR